MTSEELPLVHATLGEWRETLGDDHDGYRNHVCRS